VSIAPLIFFYFTVINDIETAYINDRKRRLLYTADFEANRLSIANYLGNLTEGPLMQILNSDMATSSRNGGYRIMVFDSSFMVVNDTNMVQTGNTLIVPEVVVALTYRNDVGIRNDEDAQVVYAAAGILNSYGERIGAVFLAEDAADIFESIDSIRQTIILYTLISGTFIVILVFFVSQILIEPLKRLLKAVRVVSSGHLSQRVPVRGYDEYSQLGISFNNMTEKLEYTEKAREEFVSNVSHELKTPLSSIKVLSESMLLEENLPLETHLEFLRDITSEVDRMTVIVNDLLELVKLDSHEQGFRSEEMNLNDLVEDVINRLAPIAKQKDVLLLYESRQLIYLYADELKLSLAISNIIENGIKYTPQKGTVKVVIEADYQNATISIYDTGIGIPTEEQNKIFNRFYRVDKTRNRGTGGTGLGLAITHSVVLHHGGTLTLNSTLGEGSVFTIKLPLQKD